MDVSQQRQTLLNLRGDYRSGYIGSTWLVKVYTFNEVNTVATLVGDRGSVVFASRTSHLNYSFTNDFKWIIVLKARILLENAVF